MKKNISGPAAVVVIVVAVVVIMGTLYMKFLHERSFTPEESVAAREKGMAKMREQMQQRMRGGAAQGAPAGQ